MPSCLFLQNALSSSIKQHAIKIAKDGDMFLFHDHWKNINFV